MRLCQMASQPLAWRLVKSRRLTEPRLGRTAPVRCHRGYHLHSSCLSLASGRTAEQSFVMVVVVVVVVRRGRRRCPVRTAENESQPPRKPPSPLLIEHDLHTSICSDLVPSIAPTYSLDGCAAPTYSLDGCAAPTSIHLSCACEHDCVRASGRACALVRALGSVVRK